MLPMILFPTAALPLRSLTGFPLGLEAIALNTALIALAFAAPKKLLTPAGYLHAWGLGVLVWASLGWRGYGVVMFYFLVGSAVTKVGFAKKAAAGIAEKRDGARGPENVWGSAAVAAICAVAIAVLRSSYPNLAIAGISLATLAYVASFATKLADTTASEIGKAYGQRTLLITTFRPVPPGTEGAVSVEGTVAGLGAATAISFLAWWVRLLSPPQMAICIAAAWIATNFESLIGATVQEKYTWLTNELVNVINTLIGAIAAVALALVFQQF